jgi:hypothetical protein
MDAQIVATVAVLAAIVFCLLQHVVVMRLHHQRNKLYDAVVAIAKGEATVRIKPDGEIEIRGG